MGLMLKRMLSQPIVLQNPLHWLRLQALSEDKAGLTPKLLHLPPFHLNTA